MRAELASKIDALVRQLAQSRAGTAHDARAVLPNAVLSRPKPEHGDLATNVALSAAKTLGMKPIELANALAELLRNEPWVLSADVAGPGFLNLRLTAAPFERGLLEILADGPLFGRAKAASGERINVEFVSANPTGPLHMAHGRGAVNGDVMCRLLEVTGHRVVREYYVNDAGGQVRLLVQSVRARANEEATPEGGYGGAYVTDLANWAKQNAAQELGGTSEEPLMRRLVSAMLAGYPGGLGIRPTLRALGIHFDVWTSEESLHRDGRVDAALSALRAGGWLAERDGALFFESSRVLSESQKDAKKTGEKVVKGDEKDRVLRKSDGSLTYFAADVAYHKDKLDRGFDRLIDLWGADHHGYIARVQGALTALGLPAGRFEVRLCQMVSIVKDGQPYRMGKRLGNFITIEEVLAEIDGAVGRENAGRDALRYFFCSRKLDAQLELDIEIAKKQSLDNPVFYLQYGYARICSILRKAEVELSLTPRDVREDDLKALSHPDEREMLLRLDEWPETLARAAKERAAHDIVHSLEELARAFQSYYTRLKNEGDPILPLASERDGEGWKTADGGARLAKTRARLAWLSAIASVYRAGLDLLGITALERMDRAPLEPGIAGDTPNPEALDVSAQVPA